LIYLAIRFGLPHNWAAAQRNKLKDFIDIIQFLRQGYSLYDAFCGCLALAKKSKTSWSINLEYLVNDFQSNRLQSLFSEEDDWHILCEAAKRINLKKVFSSKMKFFDQLFNIDSENKKQLFEYSKKKDLSFNDFARCLVWTPDSDILNDKDSFLVLY
jgi:hypothetical protein